MEKYTNIPSLICYLPPLFCRYNRLKYQLFLKLKLEITCWHIKSRVLYLKR